MVKIGPYIVIAVVPYSEDVIVTHNSDVEIQAITQYCTPEGPLDNKEKLWRLLCENKNPVSSNESISTMLNWYFIVLHYSDIPEDYQVIEHSVSDDGTEKEYVVVDYQEIVSAYS